MWYWTYVVMMSFWNLKISTKDIPSIRIWEHESEGENKNKKLMRGTEATETMGENKKGIQK